MDEDGVQSANGTILTFEGLYDNRGLGKVNKTFLAALTNKSEVVFLVVCDP
jgi:hypothetical protein